MLVDFFFLLAAYEILATGFPQGCRLHVLYELVGGSAAVDDNTVAKRELRSHEAIPWKWLWWRRWWLRRLKRSVKWERMNARAACGRHGRRWNRAGRLTPPHQIVILELIIFREYCHFPFIKALCSMAYIRFVDSLWPTISNVCSFDTGDVDWAKWEKREPSVVEVQILDYGILNNKYLIVFIVLVNQMFDSAGLCLHCSWSDLGSFFRVFWYSKKEKIWLLIIW